MAAHKRTQAQREQDLAELAKLLSRGCTQTAAAARLGVTRQQVGYDWKELLRRLAKDRDADTAAARLRKLRECQEVKAEAWAGWEKSCQDAETRHARTESPGGYYEGQPLPDKTIAEKVVKGQCGDPRFLGKVLDAVDRECQIDGLYPPKQTWLTGPDGGPVPVEVYIPDNARDKQADGDQAAAGAGNVPVESG